MGLAQPASIQPSSSSRLVPYAPVNGDWSLPDEFILSVGIQMMREGTFRRVFYDGSIRTAEDAMAHWKRPSNLPVFVFDGADEPLAVGWLNGVSGTIAFAHFCTFAAASGVAVDIGHRVLHYWSVAFPFLRAILGVIPEHNRAAIRFARSLGFSVACTIPGVLYDAYAGEYVGGSVSYLSMRK